MTDLDFVLRAMDFGMRVPLCTSSIPGFDFHYVVSDPGFVASRMLDVLEPDSDDYQHVNGFLEIWKDSGKSDSAADYLSEHLDACKHLVVLEVALITYKSDENTANMAMIMLLEYVKSGYPTFPLQLIALSLIIEWTITYSRSVLHVCDLVMMMAENKESDLFCLLQCARFYVYMGDFEEAKDRYMFIIYDTPQMSCDIMVKALARREIRQIMKEIPEKLATVLDLQDDAFCNPYIVAED